MIKTLEEIAETLEVNQNIEKAYRKISKKHPWVVELLMESYEELGKAIKFRSEINEYLTYKAAAKTIDNIVLTITEVYDRKIAELENVARTNQT